MESVTSHLDVLCESPKHLLGNFECLEEVLPPLNVNRLVVCVVPVEVGDALLETEEVVHSANHDVDRGRVAGLSSEVVLEVCIVSLAEQLKEPKETLCEQVVRKNFAQNWRNE